MTVGIFEVMQSSIFLPLSHYVIFPHLLCSVLLSLMIKFMIHSYQLALFSSQYYSFCLLRNQ